jgi:nucleoporin p58/p45
MAQRTHELPPGLQYDNVAPIEYFTELVARFEHDMQVFRQEIETTEKHIQSLSHPVALTPQGNQLCYYYIIIIMHVLHTTAYTKHKLLLKFLRYTLMLSFIYAQIFHIIASLYVF